MTFLKLHEVSPRDGLQNEAAVLSTLDKLELLRLLSLARPASIEVTSFVHPKRVPQLADADPLCQQLFQTEWALQARAEGVQYAGLVANQRGFDRLLKSGLDAVSVLVSATEGHSKANVGMSIQRASAETGKLIAQALAAKLQVRAYISMAFVCPIDGPADPEQVLDLVEQFRDQGAHRIIMADTLGCAEPAAVESLLNRALERVPAERLSMHMHDTQNRALQNCQTGWKLGIRDFDASAGGTGGCPFAPGSAGNLDSLDLLAWTEQEGIFSATLRDGLSDAAQYLRQKL
jgi:hydroxymethylglutaryl-CoA lyase